MDYQWTRRFWNVATGSGNFAIYLASQGYQVLTGEPSTDKSHYAGNDWALHAKKVGVLDNIRFEDMRVETVTLAHINDELRACFRSESLLLPTAAKRSVKLHETLILVALRLRQSELRGEE